MYCNLWNNGTIEQWYYCDGILLLDLFGVWCVVCECVGVLLFVEGVCASLIMKYEEAFWGICWSSSKTNPESHPTYNII